MSFVGINFASLRLTKMFLITCVCALVFIGLTPSAALPNDDDRYVEREVVYSSPGIHELATNLIAQIRQSSAQANGNTVPLRGFSGCGFQPPVSKRNSELINSLLGLPKQVSNGRK